MNDEIIKALSHMQSCEADLKIAKANLTSLLDAEAEKLATFKIGDKIVNEIFGIYLQIERISGYIDSDMKIRVQYNGIKLTSKGKPDKRCTPQILFDKDNKLMEVN